MNSDRINSAKSSSLWRSARYVCVLAVIIGLGALPVWAQQSFSSGSDGSDGAYNPSGPSGTVIVFDPTQFHGSQVGANIFNFTTITIPAGVTIKLSGNTLNGPVFWLAQGDVDIEGIVDLSGGNGADASSQTFYRKPSVPGSGGYGGGVGGGNSQSALPGSGTGGGAPAKYPAQAAGGVFGGNQFVIPLVGGSGGGGEYNSSGSLFGAGGGAGGGALMIASSTRILVNGTINANGGKQGAANIICAGGGSGGVIRLVSNAISGSGNLTAAGGATSQCGGSSTGGPGIIREESPTNTFFTGFTSGTVIESTPFRLFLPTAGSPTANVISVNGVAVTPNPNTFPDITINTSSSVPVVIQTQNIPINAALTLTILDPDNVADTVVQAPPLSNCTTNNVCTTTVNVTFPLGGSYGLTRVTWTLQ